MQRRQDHRQQGEAGAEKLRFGCITIDKTATQAVVAVCNFAQGRGFRI
jgi:hypothetical protein